MRIIVSGLFIWHVQRHCVDSTDPTDSECAFVSSQTESDDVWQKHHRHTHTRSEKKTHRAIESKSIYRIASFQHGLHSNFNMMKLQSIWLLFCLFACLFVHTDRTQHTELLIVFGADEKDSNVEFSGMKCVTGFNRMHTKPMQQCETNNRQNEGVWYWVAAGGLVLVYIVSFRELTRNAHGNCRNSKLFRRRRRRCCYFGCNGTGDRFNFTCSRSQAQSVGVSCIRIIRIIPTIRIIRTIRVIRLKFQNAVDLFFVDIENVWWVFIKRMPFSFDATSARTFRIWCACKFISIHCVAHATKRHWCRLGGWLACAALCCLCIIMISNGNWLRLWFKFHFLIECNASGKHTRSFHRCQECTGAPMHQRTNVPSRIHRDAIVSNTTNLYLQINCEHMSSTWAQSTSQHANTRGNLHRAVFHVGFVVYFNVRLLRSLRLGASASVCIRKRNKSPNKQIQLNQISFLKRTKPNETNHTRVHHIITRVIHI